MNEKLMFSSASDEWPTPIDFYKKLDEEFGFTLDPCSTKENAKCINFFTKEDDGLSKTWAGHVVFMNPPYGREIKHWMRKALNESRMGATVVCLVPSRTDTAWWHDYAVHGEIRFVRGRIKFGGHKNNAPFPSAIIIFRPNYISETKT